MSFAISLDGSLDESQHETLLTRVQELANQIVDVGGTCGGTFYSSIDGNTTKITGTKQPEEGEE